MQVAIGFWREAHAHLLRIYWPGSMVGGVAWASAPVTVCVRACCQVFFNDLTQKVARLGGVFVGCGWVGCVHDLILGPYNIKAVLRLSTVFTTCPVGFGPSAAFNQHMGISRPVKGELDEAIDQDIR